MGEWVSEVGIGAGKGARRRTARDPRLVEDAHEEVVAVLTRPNDKVADFARALRERTPRGQRSAGTRGQDEGRKEGARGRTRRAAHPRTQQLKSSRAGSYGWPNERSKLLHALHWRCPFFEVDPCFSPCR